jgi:hypothetical protein
MWVAEPTTAARKLREILRMASTEIRFDGLSYIRLTLEEILPRPPYRGAVDASMVVLAAEVETPEFRGRRRFSVAGRELSRWLNEMEEFEQRRAGKVVFSDEDDMAFWLVFSATDRAGHIAVSIELRWGDVVADFRWRRMLVIDGVPIDPSALPRIVDSARDLYQQVLAQHQPGHRGTLRE